jgi:hypothetical protein
LGRTPQNTALQQYFTPVSPQALPKFNSKNSLLDQFQMAHSPAIHAKNRNLASLSQNTQEMKATVVE